MMLQNIKKAAMFGLDARIALAIFGALSVISGAALYSAIEKSKVTAIITELTEIEKAWEQYYLDTGSPIPQRTTADSSIDTFYELKSSQLIENTDNVNNWKGPYLSYGIRDHYMTGAFNNDDINLLTLSDSDPAWGGSTAWWDTDAGTHCQAGGACHLWIQINYFDDSLINSIDQEIDGGDGSNLGRVKWFDFLGNTLLFIRMGITHNPNG